MNYLLRRKDFETADLLGSLMTDTKVIVSGSDYGSVSDCYLFRWGCTSTIHNQGGVKVVNNAESIHRVFNKAEFRMTLAEKGLAPRTWTDFVDFMIEKDDTQTWIIRPTKHKAGESFFHRETVVGIAEVVKELGKCYISEFIPKKKEYRVYVTSGRIVAIADKKPTDPSNPFWGCVGEGKFEYVGWGDWNLDLVRTCLEGFALSGLDFGAIDVVLSSDGRPLILEINTSPEITSYYGKRVANTFDYIVKNGRDQIPVIGSSSWRNYIHPAISNEAV